LTVSERRLLATGALLAAAFAPRLPAQDARPVADTVRAASEPLEAPLPIDPSVRVGRLSNGLRYYVRENSRPARRAELRLAVDAGSVLEDEDQRGLAHFVEHMAFNGTRSFEKQELVDYLERVGMRFGPEINAYTSFDETVYQLRVPTDSADVLDTGLRILLEWAGAIAFDSAEVERERGVVLEEWRLGRGASSRVRDRQFPVLFHGSRYAERLPIGDPEVLRGFEHGTLRRFYREWYRPDLMAVVAVGDFDGEEIEARIRELFGELRGPHDPRSRPGFDVPEHAGTLVSSVADPELTLASVAVVWKLPPSPQGTHADYRRALIEASWGSMMNFRFFEITQSSADPPFLSAGGGKGSLVRGADAFQLGAAAQPDRIGPALERLLVEARRLDAWGFTEDELERQKADMLRAYERAFEEREKSESSGHADEYVRAFLEDEPIPGIAYEYALVRRFLPEIGLEEVNRLGKDWIRDRDRVILASVPGEPAVDEVPEEALLAAFARAGTGPVEPWEEGPGEAPLLAGLPSPGAVVSEARVEAVGVTEWRLSNGARVLLKPTDFKQDQVLFSAYAPGGTSLAPDSSFISATWASSIVSAGGAGGFGAVDLQKQLAGKAVSASPFIGELEAGIGGSASPRDLETLLQLVHLYITEPRRDTVAYGSLMSRLETVLANRGASPEATWSDTMVVLLADHHPRRRPPTTEQLREVDLDEALAFYRERFAGVGDFTFTFVGSFAPEDLRPLVERYLASLPAGEAGDGWRDAGVRPPDGVIRRIVRKGVESKALTAIVFAGPFDYSREEAFLLSSTADVLDIMLREVLREELSGTYGASVDATPRKQPVGQYGVRVSFGTDPERLDELTAAAFVLIDSLSAHGASPDNLAKVKETLRRERETDLRDNGFWLSAITTYDRYGQDLALIVAYDELVAGLTGERIGAAARRYLRPDRYVQVSLLPEAEGGPPGGTPAPGEGTGP
jgi:zinc protease